MSYNENTTLVLMLKNPETGYFEEELGQYKIGEGEVFLEGFWAVQTDGGPAVCMRIGVGDLWAEIDDEMYEYIYDEYDADLLPDFVSEFTEIDGSFNPVWETRFLFSDNPAVTESMIRQVLAGHADALSLLRSENSGGGGL